jgi:hypothetical protein
LFFSSDATGEIYVITREDGSGVNSVSQVDNQTNSTNGTGSGTGTSAAPSPTRSSSAAIIKSVGDASFWIVGVAVAALAL